MTLHNILHEYINKNNNNIFTTTQSYLNQPQAHGEELKHQPGHVRPPRQVVVGCAAAVRAAGAAASAAAGTGPARVARSLSGDVRVASESHIHATRTVAPV